MFRSAGLILGSVFFVGGMAACLASAFYVFQDWHALNVFYARFEKLAMSEAPLRSLFIASTEQAAFRLNCFADGVGVLLGAILAASGWRVYGHSRKQTLLIKSGEDKIDVPFFTVTVREQ